MNVPSLPRVLTVQPLRGWLITNDDGIFQWQLAAASAVEVGPGAAVAATAVMAARPAMVRMGLNMTTLL